MPPFGPIVNVNDAPTGNVVISGTPTEDEILAADVSGIADADGLGEFSYLWSTGATTPSITLGDSDVGSSITVTVNYTDGQGTAESLTSVAVGPVANVNDLPTGDVVIVGSPLEGHVLSADTSGIADDDGLGPFSSLWSNGATTASVTLTAADVGTSVSVTVSYTDGHGAVEFLTSASVGPVGDVNSPPTGSVIITGVPTEDEILTADVTGIADADGLGPFSYLWSTGATTPSITLGDSDVGSTITVTVSFVDGGGTSESLTSAAVGPVANVNDAPTGLPMITGIARSGQTLSVSTSGIADADGLGPFTYQWLRDGAVIAGATGTTLVLSTADVGSRISVQVSYVDGHGTAEGPLTSSPTAPVEDVILDPGGTKFFVVDQSRRRTFEYDADGNALDNNRLNTEEEKPRGIAASPDGSTLWVVDAKGEVFVYDSDNNLLGNFEIEGVDKPEGITVHGDDLWIVDRGEDRVYFFEGAAPRRGGKAEPTSSFRLDRRNGNAMDIVTDGTHIWVVNSNANDRVFRYSVGGTLEGSWSIDPVNATPTGLTIDPNDVNHIWIVDAGTDSVYEYDGATALTSGSAVANSVFELAATNTNPQGIADPAPAGHPASTAPATLVPVVVQPPRTTTERLDCSDDSVQTATDDGDAVQVSTSVETNAIRWRSLLLKSSRPSISTPTESGGSRLIAADDDAAVDSVFADDLLLNELL
ncbi:MAG: hypothetical protein R3C19_21605 [Planctomycetaceae bacterium]